MDRLVENSETVRVLDVDYLHVQLGDGSDLYVTVHGVPCLANLMPENFLTDTEWFEANSVKLFGHDARFGGTSTLYRVTTKPVAGRSREIVLKWNRMGQDIPGEREGDGLLTAEFNSPYEEFALVMEMRAAWREGGSARRIRTHKPLAIYVPAEKLELWRTGRREHKMRSKMQSHDDIELDMFRPYAVIYEWVDGLNLAEVEYRGAIDEKEMWALTQAAEEDMRAQGFVVRDRKPQHVIVRLDAAGKLKRDSDGRLLYAMVDFELLERTPEREEHIRRARRAEYLRKQAHRFDREGHAPLPPHLKAANILGVDYVYGQAGTTGGRLWVVGRDPTLFDYFLPERWRMLPRTKLSPVNMTYHTVSKDNINLVWKVSRVGEVPDLDPFREEERAILDHGYNSPFEEVSLAIYLDHHGIPAAYPRAVYMTGHESELAEYLRDGSRYQSHKDILTPEGTPVLREDREYITIWGYWNKPDEMLEREDSDYYRAVDALHVFRSGQLTRRQYLELVQRTRGRLQEAGVEDLNLRGAHLLLSLTAGGDLVMDSDGLPAARVCTFELLRKATLELANDG